MLSSSLHVVAANTIREVSMKIQPGMTPYGYAVLLLASEIIDKDCPKARSGGAALAAAHILEIPPEQMVNWLKRAEQCFAKEVHIVWLPAAQPQTFVEWLGAARRARLEHVPPADDACDAQLAARMSKQEHYLLGYEPSTSMARPNAAAMELLRWLLLDKPRPQLAFCILQLKPILELGGDTLDSAMPPSWPSQWEARAAKVTSTRFYWVGQGGVEVPSTDARERGRSAADSYTRTARQRLSCVHATTSTPKQCHGPLGHFWHMCSACRMEPGAVLRDSCRRLIETGTATPSCSVSHLCSYCRGEDGRKLKDGKERINTYDVWRYQPCPGGCHRKTEACQTGYRRAMKHGDEEKQRAFCGAWHAAKPQGRGKKRARQEVSDVE